MKKLKFGLVGAGGIAQAYAQAFNESTCCELVAVADVREESAKALAEIVGGKAYSSYQSFIENNVEMDAVIVATPPTTHAEIACYFMERKIPVLCEKPLCTTVAEAEKMIRTAEENSVLFTMASKFRYCNDVIKAKGIVASGTLGEVVQFENAFTAKVDMSKRWNSDAKVSGGGVLIDNGTHSVDIIRYMLGPVESVLVVDSGSTQGLSVDENVKMFAKTKDVIVASVDLTWGINKELPYFISIYGTNGTLHIGWRESKYKLNSSPDWTVFGKGYDKTASFKGKIENFAGALRGSEDLLINPADAMASVQVIEAAYKSLNQNLWQTVVEKAATAAK
ncbi:MAG TPA: Gfo/Idh/MocA family oxidoreductase [Pyrinomonadaceae bacterium]|jgi:predicted dehydrogenase|nr:Gfo/Idh/MocA family oxidoreductase [Pyrinomonadaceae bacterium]